MFINEDGKIDRSVLRYFEQVGKEHAFDSVAQAMRSGQLRDREMMELARVAVHSTGKNNPQGDTLFRDIMTSDNYSMDVKMQTIRSMDDLEDQAILQSRLALMDSIHYGEGDIMGRANEIYSGRVQSKMTKGGFRDQKQYDAMHADFRKINKQVKRGQRPGNIQRNVPSGPTIVPSP